MSDPISRDLSAILAGDQDVTQLQIAQAIGRHQSMVSLYARGSRRGGHDIPAVLVPAICAALDDFRLMHTLARLCGEQFVLDPAPSLDVAESELRRSVLHVCGAAEYQALARDAEADGVLSETELRNLLGQAEHQLKLWNAAQYRHATALQKIEIGRAVNNAIRRVVT